MKEILKRALDTLTDSIIYDSARPMAALLSARDALRDAYNQALEKQPYSTLRDYQLVVPGAVVRIPEPGQEHLPSWEKAIAYTHHTDSTVVYMLDGRATTGKIFAIKYIRNRDGIGLKEAKDYIDGLAQVFAESRDLTQ